MTIADIKEIIKRKDAEKETDRWFSAICIREHQKTRGTIKVDERCRIKKFFHYYKNDIYTFEVDVLEGHSGTYQEYTYQEIIEYFVTEKEQRKMKLDKINKTRISQVYSPSLSANRNDSSVLLLLVERITH